MDSLKILIVDDLSFMRDAIRNILESSGISNIDEAENGREAFSAYKREKPDIVLMDITIPVLDGLESLRIIRRYDETAKVIMCSAIGQQKYLIRAIQLGARDFILKPFQPERILSAIKKAVGINDK
ncbi:MAG: response regulator [Spirochaetales bacterium]|nr:response regulator [Spirochaetales bacterium]